MKIIKYCVLGATWLALFGAVSPADAAYQMPVTFTGYTNRTEALTNFPVLVVLSNNVGNSGFNFSAMPFLSTNGWDLRFKENLADTGSLNYEIESFTAGSVAYVWVQVPVIPTNGTGSLWVTWGNSSNSSQLACTTNGAVWGSRYAAVWHLPDSATLTANDATTNNNKCTPYGGVSATVGVVAGGASFNGSSGYMRTDANILLSSVQKLTVSLWLKQTVYDGNWGVLAELSPNCNSFPDGSFWIIPSGGSDFEINPYGPGPTYNQTGFTQPSAAAWHYYTFVLDRASTTPQVRAIYVDGVSQLLTTINSTLAAGTYFKDEILYFMSRGGSSLFNGGQLDEIRFQKEVVSSNWVWACYQTMASNGSFNAYGAAEDTNLTAPGISMQPADQYVPVGQAATFSAMASGARPLSYQWRVNGVGRSGATNASYTTPAVSAGDAGTGFDVMVANSLGSVTSSVATLYLNQLPSVSLTNPVAGTAFRTTDEITLMATAEDPDGSVTNVAFYAGATKLADDTVAPFTYTWAGMGAGSYALTAIATDNHGKTATSGMATVTVRVVSSYTGFNSARSGTAEVIPLEATVVEVPPQISIKTYVGGVFDIYRKDYTNTSWGTALATNVALTAGAVWVDSTVVTEVLYEYKWVNTTGSTYNTIKPTGYILSGIRVDQTQPKGRLALVVATDVPVALPAEYAQFKNDLRADGWMVHEIPVARAAGYNVTGSNFLSTLSIAPGATSYYNGDAVTITNASGSMVPGTVVADASHVLTGLTLGYGGSGFTVGESLAILTPVRLEIVSGGAGYAQWSSVSIVTSAGNSGNWVSAVDSNGVVTSINVTVWAGININSRLLRTYANGEVVTNITTTGGGTGLTLRVVYGSGTPVTVASVGTGTPPDNLAIRSQIQALYNAYPGELKNVILLGKVPVTRSGLYDIYGADGHGNECAYGTDAFYADMDGTWSDTNNNYTTQTGGDQLNGPRDGKFDQRKIFETGPGGTNGAVELGFGRIDLTAGIVNDVEALRNYFNKLHRYKVASADFRPGRYVCDRMFYPNVSETACMSMPAVVGMTNIEAITSASLPVSDGDADQLYSAINGPYLFYFKGSGAPGYGEGGKAVFWTGMQSGWGYWYEAVWLSSGGNAMQLRLSEESYTLSFTWSIWGLRYIYHRMAMGFDAGDMMRQSINNNGWSTSGTYSYKYDNVSNGDFHGSLYMDHMGDPTLRLYMFSPPSKLAVVKSTDHPALAWTASPETGVAGYHVYRSPGGTGTYQRLTSTPLAALAYDDSSVTSGQYTYMVRAVRLETTGAGTFYNPSLGIEQAIDLSGAPAVVSIVTTSLVAAAWKTSYSQPLVAQGGYPWFGWTVVAGALPTGMVLTTEGVISGAPAVAGEFAFTVRATDRVGTFAEQALNLEVGFNDANVLYPEATTYTASSVPTLNFGVSETTVILGNQGAYGALVETYHRYNLSGLNVHNGFVKATLQLYVTSETLPGTHSLVESHLVDDTLDGWGETTMVYTNRPTLYNPTTSTLWAASEPVAGSVLELDVTPYVAETLANDPAKLMSLHVFTKTPRGVSFGSRRSYGLAKPRLVLETSDAPSISITSPTVNPACLYTGSGLGISATVSAIPARKGSVSVLWTKVFGPGAVAFSSTTTPSTEVSFSTAGDYVLRLSADDGALQSFKEIMVRVLTTAITGANANDGLVLRLPFDATTGTLAADASGVTPPNSGVLTNNGATLPAWSPAGGRLGGALAFSGSGQQVVVPDSSTNLMDGLSQMSISLWLYAQGNFNIWPTVFVKLAPNLVDASYILAINGLGQMRIGLGGQVVEGAHLLSTQQWYHVAIVFDGSQATNNLKVYLNGSPEAFATVLDSGLPRLSVPRYPNAPLYIGSGAGDPGGWNGKLDEFRIYNKALTQAEVLDLYAAVPANMGPVVSVTGATAGTVGVPFALSGVVTDDGQPGPLALSWSRVSGSGDATFGDAASSSTTATISSPGLAVLRLTANDGSITSWADLMATLYDPIRLRPAVGGGEGMFRMTYEKNLSQTGTPFTVEASTNLVSWFPEDASEVVLSTSNMVQTIEIRVNVTNEPIKFFRMLYTYP
ncbi:MAG: DUF2341 domain-containing protein [bacterium]